MTAVTRVLDFTALLFIGAFFSLSGGMDEFWVRGLALSALVTFALGFGLILTRRSRNQEWLPRPLRSQLAVLQLRLRQVSVRQVALAALWTLPSWALEAAVIIVAAKVLGVELSMAAAIDSSTPSPFCFRCSM